MGQSYKKRRNNITVKRASKKTFPNFTEKLSRKKTETIAAVEWKGENRNGGRSEQKMSGMNVKNLENQ